MHDVLAKADLRSRMQRVLILLSEYLVQQRKAGRDPSTDPLRGVAIAEAEAESLVEDLTADLARFREPWTDPPVPAGGGSDTDALPLHRAARVFRLSQTDLDALVLAIAVEADHRFARLVAYLNDHIAHTRPTLGMVLALTGTSMNAVEMSQRPMLRHGLLLLEGDAPLSERALRVAPEMLARLAAPGSVAHMPPGVRLRAGAGPSLDQLVVSPPQRKILHEWAASDQVWPHGAPLVLAGPDGAGRATAAHAASASVGRPLIEMTWAPDHPHTVAVAAREAIWHDAALLVRVRAEQREPDFAALWKALALWELPVAVSLPAPLVEPACAAAPAEPALIRFEPTTVEQRENLWRWLVPADRGTLSEQQRSELASRFDFVPGMLARAVRRAKADLAVAGGDDRLDFEALSIACRAVGTAGVGSMAQRLAQPYQRSDLVLPADLMDELDLAAVWMRNRRRVFEDWGFGRRVVLGRGLTALFGGEPGTGKTMAAQVLARDLGLELFRVDLSRVMSKYIGETEKHLSELFDDARASGAILFFDEADALFGKRTEVKDAHDRYANLEISYLLQRMEEHVGTTVLATNRIGDLDKAFTRRFHFILEFPMPKPPERRRIWQGMLPSEVERDPDIDLDSLALDYEVSGGEIRNSVLGAAFMAAGEGTALGLRHLKRALRRELLKTGRVLDNRQRRALDG